MNSTVEGNEIHADLLCKTDGQLNNISVCESA